MEDFSFWKYNEDVGMRRKGLELLMLILYLEAGFI
jgi:hypothetical protein